MAEKIEDVSLIDAVVARLTADERPTLLGRFPLLGGLRSLAEELVPGTEP